MDFDPLLNPAPKSKKDEVPIDNTFFDMHAPKASDYKPVQKKVRRRLAPGEIKKPKTIVPDNFTFESKQETKIVDQENTPPKKSEPAVKPKPVKPEPVKSEPVVKHEPVKRVSSKSKEDLAREEFERQRMAIIRDKKEDKIFASEPAKPKHIRKFFVAEDDDDDEEEEPKEEPKKPVVQKKTAPPLPSKEGRTSLKPKPLFEQKSTFKETVVDPSLLKVDDDDLEQLTKKLSLSDNDTKQPKQQPKPQAKQQPKPKPQPKPSVNKQEEKPEEDVENIFLSSDNNLTKSKVDDDLFKILEKHESKEESNTGDDFNLDEYIKRSSVRRKGLFE